MSGSVNKVVLIGNLVRDPEVRNFSNGGMVVNLTVATNETWKDRQTGERKERSEYHRVAIFSEPLAKVAEQYLHKGSKVYLEGQLETRKWQDQTGQDKYSTEVVLRPYKSELIMLDNAPAETGDRSTMPSTSAPHPASQVSSSAAGMPSAAVGVASALPEDDIPF